jgi:hypothetical protein
MTDSNCTLVMELANTPPKDYRMALRRQLNTFIVTETLYRLYALSMGRSIPFLGTSFAVLPKMGLT